MDINKIINGEDTLCNFCGKLEGEHSKEQIEECDKRRKEFVKIFFKRTHAGG